MLYLMNMVLFNVPVPCGSISHATPPSHREQEYTRPRSEFRGRLTPEPLLLAIKQYCKSPRCISALKILWRCPTSRDCDLNDRGYGPRPRSFKSQVSLIWDHFRNVVLRGTLPNAGHSRAIPSCQWTKEPQKWGSLGNTAWKRIVSHSHYLCLQTVP